MNIKFRNYKEIEKFQEGGEMAPPAEEAPVEGGTPEQGGDPMQQLLQAAAQALQTQDCNLAMQVLQALLQAVGGGGEEQAPAAPEGQAPVYRKGGKFSHWVSK